VSLRVFALTGGIGSGKSSVARYFRERGVPIIDADLLAREVVAPGSPGLAQVVAAFGAEVLTAEGELDRAALARRVFADPAERAALERITHPRVRALARARFAELDGRGEPLAGYEVPLLFEAGLERDYHPTIVVSCSPAQQQQRAARRDGKTAAAIQARIAAQMPLAEKVSRADYVIDNSGDFEATRVNADRVLAAVCTELGVDPARYFAPQV
jgi:dephospho-CoA kinase